ncbi:ankyrin repeat domain-containing protein 13C-like isoform X2 [Convolutriloba macropyga]|uniref:ankyrin repeat domain-containing protein 13C-like isoform X2 n=1 Tax=Convolutriloba macropyga TaxID=536237 RepID=UPI003F524E54
MPEDTKLLSRSLEPFELNRDVFENNLPKLRQVWQNDSALLNEALMHRDTHGLSPVHLAFRLGRDEFLEVFLSCAESRHFTTFIKKSPPFKWSVLDEAITYGNRDFIKEVLRHKKREVGYLLGEPLASLMWLVVNRGREFFLKFTLQLKPSIFNRLALRGPVSVYKKGRKIRIDFTVKINNKPMSLQFIYNADKYKWDSYYFVDPKRRAFVKKKLGEQESDLDMDLMAQELVYEPLTCSSSFSKSISHMTLKVAVKRGKLRYEKIGKNSCLWYNWSGIRARSYKRFEHLCPDSTRKLSKEARSWADIVTEVDMGRHRLEGGSFEDYLAGCYYMGRQMKVIEIDKRLSGSMGVTREMPIEMEKLLDFFRVSSDDIREFILAVTEEIPVALPGGFPSYTEVILKRSPNIKLCVTVDNFDWKLPSDVREDDSLFEVPADCKESPKANLKKLRDALKL